MEGREEKTMVLETDMEAEPSFLSASAEEGLCKRFLRNRRELEDVINIENPYSQPDFFFSTKRGKCGNGVL